VGNVLLSSATSSWMSSRTVCRESSSRATRSRSPRASRQVRTKELMDSDRDPMVEMRVAHPVAIDKGSMILWDIMIIDMRQWDSRARGTETGFQLTGIIWSGIPNWLMSSMHFTKALNIYKVASLAH
jgi:hypothetical protein